MVYFSYNDYVHPMENEKMPANFPVMTKRGAPVPYYMAFPVNDGWEAEEENQRDYEYIRQLYPEKMQHIMSVIEDECDKLEYEGSMMFDEYPDRLMLSRLCNKIYDRVQGQEVEMEEVYEAMQRRPPRPGMSGPGMPPPPPPRPGMPGPGMPPPPPRPGQGNNWLSDAIQALLFDEMYRRRCRYRNGKCRRWRLP